MTAINEVVMDLDKCLSILNGLINKDITIVHWSRLYSGKMAITVKSIEIAKSIQPVYPMLTINGHYSKEICSFTLSLITDMYIYMETLI